MKELMPELRFPEFEGEWMEKRFKDCVTLNQGLQIAIESRYTEYREGTYFYITNEFLKGSSGKKYYIKSPPENVICRKNDVLMTRTGNTGKVVTNVEGAFHNNFFRINYDKEIIDQFFLFNFLNRDITQYKILALAGSSTIPDLNHSDFYRLLFSFPILQEQTKIADFLSAVDEQISLLTEKQEKLQTYKRGVMQKLFSQELRFKDEHGADYPEWEEKEFEDVFTSVSTRKYQVNKSDYQDEGSFPIVDQGQRKVIGYSSESDKVYRNGEVIVFGDHTTILKYIDFDFIVGADGVKLLVSKGESNLRYLYYSLVVNNVQSEGYKRHFSILKEITLFIHSLPEQTKIANFLTAIDSQLEEVEAQIAQTKVFKQGLLQKMFV